MKLYPNPPTAQTYFLSAVLGVVCVIAVERWFGQSLYNYFAFGVPLVLAWALATIVVAAFAAALGFITVFAVPAS